MRNTSAPAPGASSNSVAAGNNNRITFAATEDLGGGMRAMANAQIRFDPASGGLEGAGARPPFQGETRVGIAGGFGTIMLGRGLSALQGPNSAADPWGVTTVAGSIYNPGFATDYAAGGEGRIDQGIWYSTPSFQGFTLSVSHSPRKVITDGVTSKTHQSFHAGYSSGPLSLNVGHERNRGGDTLQQVFGRYNLGFATIIGSAAKIEGGTADEQAAAGAFAATAVAGNRTAAAVAALNRVAALGEIDSYAIGAIIPFGATSVRIGYSAFNGNGAPDARDESKVGIGVRHDLSKRTYVYSNLAQSTRDNNASTPGNRLTNNNNLRAFDVGMSHSF